VPDDEIEKWLGGVRELQRVIPVLTERPLRGGGRIIISSVELWDSFVVVRYAETPPPSMGNPSAAHQNHLWALSDDVVIDYGFSFGGGGGDDRFWHAYAAFVPAVDTRARRLFLFPPRLATEAPIEVQLDSPAP
jgi:hypothetical protein